MSIPYLIRYLDYSNIEKWAHKAWPMTGSSYDTGALIDNILESLKVGGTLLEVWRLYPNAHCIYCDQEQFEAEAAERALVRTCDTISEMANAPSDSAVDASPGRDVASITLFSLEAAKSHIRDSVFRPNSPFRGQVSLHLIDDERVIKVGGCTFTLDDIRAFATILMRT